MPEIIFLGFKGEVPKLEPHLLGPMNAQLAKDCDFDSGALAPVNAGFEIATVASNPAKGFYTDDGITFFSWPVETQAHASPISNDEFNRIYYLQPSVGTLMVANRTEMSPLGPVPTTVVRAGLPAPTVKPTLSLRDRTTLPDYPTVTITAEVWWQDLATQQAVNRTAATITPLTALRTYQVSLPSLTGAPAARRLGSKLLFTDTSSGKEIFSLTTVSASTTKSMAVPGTVEGLLQEDLVKGIWYLTWGVQESRAYTYTYENTWEEESAAAPPEVISPTYVQDVQIDVTPADFSGHRPFLRYNIYRTYGNVATYLKTNVVADGSVATRFYDSTTRPQNVGDVLESSEFLQLGTGMQGWEVMPNGWAAAFKDKTLYLSEPYAYHAWPYSTVFNKAIRGIRAAQSALVVTTADGVYLVTGAVPAAKQQMKLSLPQAGVAQRSMTNIEGAVAYASNDGIALVAGGQGTMDVSQKLFNRKKWRERYGDVLLDASLMFGYHDGMLVAQSNTTAKGFVVRLDDDAGAFTRNENRYDAMQQLPVTDALYYSLANKIYRFRGHTDVVPFDWWSKDFIFHRDVTFGCGFIEAEGPVTLLLYANATLVATEVLVSGTNVINGYFRLSDMPPELKWSVRLQGSAKVKRFAIARTMNDLQRVLQ